MIGIRILSYVRQTEFGIKQIRDQAELNGYRDRWDALARQMRWPFFEMGWLLPAMQFLESGECLAIVVEQWSDLVGAVLLAPDNQRLGAVYSPVGTRALGDPSMMLVRDAVVENQLLSHLTCLGCPVFLPRMIRTLDDLPLAAGVPLAQGMIFKPDAAGSPWLRLEGGIEEAMQFVSAERRGTLRRKHRQLRKQGKIDFTVKYPDKEEVKEDLRSFVELEDAGWKGQRGSSILRRNGFIEFFAQGLRYFSYTGRVRVDELKIDSRTIAMQIGIVSDGRYFLVKPTYDESFGRYSPGYLLTAEAIQSCVEDGLESYEFMGAEDRWKLDWTKNIHRCESTVFYPYSAAGIYRLTKDTLSSLSKRVKKE